MEEFVVKTVNSSFEVYTKTGARRYFDVIRMRNSQGYASIEIRYSDSVCIRIDTGDFGDDYERIIRNFAELLIRIADNPCKLPE